MFFILCSILGMNLFGCKFCDKTLKGEKGEEQVCDRKNFDSLLWAIVTVFQVIICARLIRNLMEESPQRVGLACLHCNLRLALRS